MNQHFFSQEFSNHHLLSKIAAIKEKTVLELGWSDAMINLDNIAVDDAVNAALWGRIQNMGQICI